MSKSDNLTLAILFDETDGIPPSNKEAIQKFIEIGKSKNIECDVMCPRTTPGFQFFSYDAFFIRSTTSTSTHDCNRIISSYAYMSNKACIDDITSIYKGCDKIYQAREFIKSGINIPLTKVIGSYSYQNFEFKFPCILKDPESCFSGGVYKANNRKEFMSICARRAVYNPLLVQEFIETEFDWRILILNGKPLAAIKYYMVKDDYRILVQEENGYQCGEFECVPLKKVPVQVKHLAIQASKLIGDGLYGVDLKEKDGMVYVIEVNDNPDIDAGVEDSLEGDKIYSTILDWFIERV